MFLAIYNPGYEATFVLVFEQNQVSVRIFGAATTASTVRQETRNQIRYTHTRVMMTSSPI